MLVSNCVCFSNSDGSDCCRTWFLLFLLFLSCLTSAPPLLECISGILCNISELLQ